MLKNQKPLPLFDAADAEDYPDPPSQPVETSRQAAEQIKITAGTLRAKVHAFISDRGTFGATDDEMQRLIPMDPSTQRPRRIELVKASQVIDSGKKRKTSSGRDAVVWIAAGA